MSSIYIVPESFSPQFSTSGIYPGQKLPILSIGDILETRVTELLSENRVLLSTQNHRMVASATTPLSLGQKLRVQVERIQPEILLRVIESQVSESRRMNQGLRAFLSDPDGLFILFSQAVKMFSALDDGALPVGVRSCLQEMFRLFNTLILSEEAMRNPLFIKEFVSTLGLDLENRLLKNLKQPVGSGDAEMWKGNLKGILVKLIEQLQTQNSKLPASEVLSRLNAFAQDGVEALETHQMVNALFQSQDDAFMLQLPLLLPSGLSMADVFFHRKALPKDTDRSVGSYTVVMFLDMDAMGALMVEAWFNDAQVGCSIRCQNPEVRAYIAEHLERLGEAFKSMGLQVGQLSCVFEPEISRRRAEHLKNLTSFEKDAVNLFA